LTDQHETILGPPGTGKTQTNSNKIRDFIEQGISPDRIACVSFTRKAAKESRDRVCKDWGIDERDMPYFQTLHSMAFRAGGYSSDEVVGPKEMIEIGDAVGIPFGSKGKSDIETDFDTVGVAKGDFYMSQYHLSRSKGLTLEEMHRQLADYNVDWCELKRLVDAYKDYKNARKKIDFTDMIDNFIKSGEGPEIEALFVDEAQDLSTLQWSMVDVLRKKPRIQVFTGDDDQAIMGFQGADVEAFLNATEKKTVLEQSYRVPRSVWQEAQNIVSRIEGRAPKSWRPKEEDGTVQFHQNIWDVPLHEGEWCLMARTNRIASQYAQALREEGWVYSRNGHPSIPAKTYEALHDWEEWAKGEPLTPTKVRNVYGFMNMGEGYSRGFGPRSGALMGLNREALISMSEAQEKMGLLVDGSVRWHQALGKIDLDTKNYVLNALKRKDNVRNPRIKVSTIHSMKGGESDNVLVVPDLSYAAHKEYQTNPATEHRVYYVAVTRTKKALHIMLPQTNRNYPL
jgi:superfamily I DNA/RNA helicase